MGAHDYLAQGVATMRTSAHRRTDQQYQERIFKHVYSFDFFVWLFLLLAETKHGIGDSHRVLLITSPMMYAAESNMRNAIQFNDESQSPT